MTQWIFKIAEAEAWAEAARAGAFSGSADDVRDGYIHFSTADQLKGTLAKHYAGRAGLLLAAVDAESLGEALRWEPARNGALFPHLYGPLLIEDIAGLWPLPLSADGQHALPEGLPR